MSTHTRVQLSEADIRVICEQKFAEKKSDLDTRGIDPFSCRELQKTSIEAFYCNWSVETL